jgi:hypothetical protein
MMAAVNQKVKVRALFVAELKQNRNLPYQYFGSLRLTEITQLKKLGNER